ncbi:hypothetical protein HYALB_00009850 [Hymenoscyphus albidus]|uniref:Subtilisin-like protein n=1 Tax=Hymenoscyphus albidus TaxID=595503 RepID=A0A9N9M441_9HELO|nr:hypothetical protein HYALB_00009850 [Hymenoscyphus albidus]
MVEHVGGPFTLAPYQERLAAEVSGCQLQVREVFDSPYLVGGSFDVKCLDTCEEAMVLSARILSALRSLDSVVRVWQVAQQPIPVPSLEPRDLDALTNHHQDGTGPLVAEDWAADPDLTDPAPTSMPKRKRQQQQQHFGKREDDASTSASSNTGPYVQHVTTGVSQMHQVGFRGKGVHIALIDDGFEPVGLSAFSKTQIVHTHNVADNSANVAHVPGTGSHGTCVLGVIGSDSDHKHDHPFGFVGVAPEAEYTLVAVTRANEQFWEDGMTQALLYAASRKPDIISMSLSTVITYPEHPLPYIAQKIQESGIFVSFPAGNQAEKQPLFALHAPATSRVTSSVGATDSPSLISFSFGVQLDDGTTLRYAPGTVLQLGPNPWKIWFPADAELLPPGCHVLPKPPKNLLPNDLQNTILLIDAHHCWNHWETNKAITAQLGIRAILYYTPSSLSWMDGVSFPSVPYGFVDAITHSALISYTDSRVLIEMMSKSSGELKITFPAQGSEGRFSQIVHPRSGGLVAPFSNWGPSLDGHMAPTIVAPGGSMLCPLPKALRSGIGWTIQDGTSFATPFVAGSAALLIEKFRKENRDASPLAIQLALVANAYPRLYPSSRPEAPLMAPIFQQGAGRVNAFDAAHTTSSIDRLSLDFNDTTHRPSSLTFGLRNLTPQPITYTLGHLKAASGYLLDQTGHRRAAKDVHGVYPSIQISPEYVTVPPNSATQISVSITKEPDLPDKDWRGTFFGGFVTISSPEQKLSIPYTGIGGALNNIPMIDRQRSQLIGTDGESLEKFKEGHEFICMYDDIGPYPVSCLRNRQRRDLKPGVIIQAGLPTRRARFEIWSMQNQQRVLTVIPTQETEARPFLLDNALMFWNGKSEGRKFLPAGKYKWVVSVLKMFGKEDVAEDWDTWFSPMWKLTWDEGSIFPLEETIEPRPAKKCRVR